MKTDSKNLMVPVNISELLEIMDDDMELVKECFDDFETDSVKQLQAINENINAGDFSRLKANAHKLKGTLRYLAAENASKLAFTLETMGTDKNLVSAKETFDNLANECKRVIAYMAKYKK